VRAERFLLPGRPSRTSCSRGVGAPDVPRGAVELGPTGPSLDGPVRCGVSVSVSVSGDRRDLR
jgi:hypothetical protein